MIISWWMNIPHWELRCPGFWHHIAQEIVITVTQPLPHISNCNFSSYFENMAIFFYTKAIFVHSVGWKKALYTWTKSRPAGDRVVHQFLAEKSLEFRSQEVCGGWRHSCQATVVQCGVSCFCTRTADSCPTFPAVKGVLLVNPQLFLILSQGPVSCNVWCLGSLAHGIATASLASGNFLVPSYFQVAKRKNVPSIRNHTSQHSGRPEKIVLIERNRFGLLSFGSYTINHLGISRDLCSTCESSELTKGRP